MIPYASRCGMSAPRRLLVSFSAGCEESCEVFGPDDEDEAVE